MATLTANKQITYTEADSGASFTITTRKVKTGRHGYRQVMECGNGVQRRLFEIGSNPNYSKMVFFHVENIGDYDVSVHVRTAGTDADAGIIVPPGRTFELFNTNHWNDNSTSDPDSITEIIGQGIGGTAKVKIDAIIA